MKILIKGRNEAQATKILEQEKTEEFFQHMLEFIGAPEEPENQEEPDRNAVHEADVCFDWISGQYDLVEDDD